MRRLAVSEVIRIATTSSALRGCSEISVQEIVLEIVLVAASARERVLELVHVYPASES